MSYDIDFNINEQPNLTQRVSVIDISDASSCPRLWDYTMAGIGHK